MPAPGATVLLGILDRLEAGAGVGAAAEVAEVADPGAPSRRAIAAWVLACASLACGAGHWVDHRTGWRAAGGFLRGDAPALGAEPA